MKSFIWSSIAILSAALCSSASDVTLLNNTQEFNDAIQNHDLVLIKFFAPWCPHSQAILPEYQTAAIQLKSDNILMAEVDCDVNNDLCTRYSVQGYPTLQLFRKGNPSDIYADERTSDSIVKYMKEHLSTRLVTLQSQEELKALKNKEPLVAVAYISAKDKANLDTWNQLSEKLIDDFAFGIVTDSSLASVEGITTFPSVVLYKPFDHLRDVHTGPIVPDQIEDFIKVNAVPLLAQIEPSSFMDYVDAGRPLAYIFSNSATMQDEMHQLFLPLAQRYKGRFSFVHIDASLYSSQADFLSLTKNTWPAFAVHNFKSGARFAYQQDKPLTESDVMSFLDTIETGQAEPVVKSQSFIAEESEDAAVKVVVGKNFDKIVFDKTKDVLLEIYAPWCGHCKVLAPIYQQLGEVMQANHAERDHGVVIAKMDGTVNDVPPSAGFEISGFPTIKLFKADGKVIDYSGPRKLHDLARFLNEHSTKQTLRVDLDNLPKRDEKVVVDQHSKRDEL